MFCQFCGKELTEVMPKCENCGQDNPNYAGAVQNMQESGRGVMILIFGILSLVSLGPLLGIPAWILGHIDMKKIKAGIIPESERSMTQAGMIMGIISTALFALAIIIVIIMFAFIFSAHSSEFDFSQAAVVM